MRTLGFGTKVASVCFFAAALVLTLTLPWYGPAPKPAADDKAFGELSGPLDGLFEAITRWVSEYDDGTSAWRAFETADVIIIAFAALAAAAAVLANLTAVEHSARSLLRGCVVVALGVVIVKLFDTPGDNALMEPRYGVFAATAAAVMLAVSGFGLAEQRLRATRRRAPSSYSASATRPAWQEDIGTSAPPPGL